MPEHRDHQRQPEQGEDHQHQLVDRLPLLVGERRLVLDRDDREVLDDLVEPVLQAESVPPASRIRALSEAGYPWSFSVVSVVTVWKKRTGFFL